MTRPDRVQSGSAKARKFDPDATEMYRFPSKTYVIGEARQNTRPVAVAIAPPRLVSGPTAGSYHTPCAAWVSMAQNGIST